MTVGGDSGVGDGLVQDRIGSRPEFHSSFAIAHSFIVVTLWGVDSSLSAKDQSVPFLKINLRVAVKVELRCPGWFNLKTSARLFGLDPNYLSSVK
jgi:hypothetical protein